MSKITPDLMKRIAPTISEQLRAEYTQWLNFYLPKYGITTKLRLDAFFANFMEESGRFSRLEENLNYSARRLMQVWPKRFPTLAKAQIYAGDPQKLANYVYGGRNGNVQPNDGWTYRGGGLGQTTGRGNYAETGKHMHLDLVAHPEMLRIPRYAVQSACVEWTRRGCNDMADRRQLRSTRLAINGGYNGMDHVQTFYEQVARWIPDGFVLDEAEDAAPTENTAVGFASPLPADSQHVSDTAMAEDSGVPSDGSDNAPESDSNGSDDTSTALEAENGSEGQETSGNDASSPPSGAAPDATVDDKAKSPQLVDKEKPSLFSRVMTGIVGAIGTAVAAVTSTCGGNELATQAGSKAIDAADSTQIIHLAIWLVFIALGLGFAVLLFYVATRVYETAAQRNHELNIEKIKAASSQTLNTVELKK